MACGNQRSDQNLVTHRLESGVHLRYTLVQPWRELQLGMLHDQMDIFMDRGRERFSPGVTHYDVIVIGGRMIISGRKLVETIWFVLLRGIERYDPYPNYFLERSGHRLVEKATHLLEVLKGGSRAPLAGGGVHLEV